MVNLNYCVNCKRIFNSEELCQYCNSNNIKPLKMGTSVNVIGTKNKGMILNYKEGLISVILKTEGNEKVVKEYNANELRKIL